MRKAAHAVALGAAACLALTGLGAHAEEAAHAARAQEQRSAAEAQEAQGVEPGAPAAEVTPAAQAVDSAAAAPAVPQAGRPEVKLQELLKDYYAPLSDPNQGRLLEAAAALLKAAREMPKSVDLGVRLPAGAAEAEAARSPAPGTPLVRKRAEEPKWVAILDHPVVDDEDLAYAHFLAGEYAAASALYGKLFERSPDDAHLLLMVLLAERNAGNVDKARKLLDEMRKKGDEPAKWADWLEAMTKLGEQKPQEAR